MMILMGKQTQIHVKTFGSRPVVGFRNFENAVNRESDLHHQNKRSGVARKNTHDKAKSAPTASAGRSGPK